MFLIYQLLLTLVILISPFIIIVRILKGKEDIKRFKEKFCLFSKKRHRGKILWFHGSSVGEIMSAIPLINKYDKVNYESSEYNKLYENIVVKNISSLNDDPKISVYSKNIITSILNNKLFKLKSEVIDSEIYYEYIDTLNEEIQNLINNDKVMIDNYSDFELISNILNSNNIKYDINNFSNLNKLEKFNLLYNICIKYNVDI